MRYSSRFFLYAPFAGLLLLAAVAMIHWWTAASALAKKLDAMNRHEIMPGVRINFAAKRLAGFPFRLDVILSDLRLEVGDASGPVVWTCENFAIHRLAYGRVQAVLEAAGQQTLSWTDANGQPHRFAFLPGTFRASAILDHGKLVRFDAEIADLDGRDFRAANAQFHFRLVRHGADLYLRLQKAHIAGGYARDLGSDIPSLVANASLGRVELLENLLRGDQSPNAALETWRINGGSLAIHALSLTNGNNTRNFSGRLSLNQKHDLSGVLRDMRKAQLQFDSGRIRASGPARP